MNENRLTDSETEPTAEGQCAVNVTIVYQDIASGQRAMRLFCDVANDHAGQLAFCPNLWRVDLLADAGWREAAAEDATRADIIVISTKDGSLPDPVQRWLALSAEHGAHAALIGLVGESAETNKRPGAGLLKTFAAEHGLEFLAPCPDAKGAEGAAASGGPALQQSHDVLDAQGSGAIS